MVSTDGRASLKGGSTTRDRRLAGARHLAQNPRFIARGIFERKSPVVSYCAWFIGPPPARARAALRARDDARRRDARCARGRRDAREDARERDARDGDATRDDDDARDLDAKNHATRTSIARTSVTKTFTLGY
jgi:hypothetical protein